MFRGTGWSTVEDERYRSGNDNSSAIDTTSGIYLHQDMIIITVVCCYGGLIMHVNLSI